ncbi:hypothetical protein ACIRYZ_30985 [Kitasatospora sp. NPDC101155]|uniref:hypothetical protein n=1 Tax=Kitasatospora sp. NPDC101155 TaxID=3364097 RepID=UPI00381DF1ED
MTVAHTLAASVAFPAAVSCLALALAWEGGMALLDDRAIHRSYPRAGIYHLGRGWAGPDALSAQRRRAIAKSATAAALLPTAFLPASRWTAAAALLCCGLACVWILGDGSPRYTSICLLVLLAVIALNQATVIALGSPPTALTGVIASFFATQMYLVAGIRKIRSPHFMSGGVLVDNIVYNAWQAAAGNRDFLPVPHPHRLTVLLPAPAFRTACRAAAVATAGVEVTLGLGALGLIPATATVLLAVPTHLAFTAISPRRIVPFSTALLGLLLLATSHPLLTTMSG